MRNLMILLGCAALMALASSQATPPEPIQRKLQSIRTLLEFRLVQLADEYWHDGQHYKTMAILFVLIEYDPSDVETYSNLGWMLDSYGETARAFQVYERGLRANPNRYDLYYDIGFWYYQKGDYARARTYLEKAVQFANIPVFVWKTLAHTYEKLGEYEKCLQAWEKARQVDPTDGAVPLNMERVRKKLKGSQRSNS